MPRPSPLRLGLTLIVLIALGVWSYGWIQDAYLAGQLSTGVRAGDTAAVRKLLAAGADRNVLLGNPLIADTTTYPLIVAAAAGDVEMVSTLLEGGADSNRHGSWGATPLGAAQDQRQTEVAEVLRSCGARQ